MSKKVQLDLSFVDQINSRLPSAACHAAIELDNTRLRFLEHLQDYKSLGWTCNGLEGMVEGQPDYLNPGTMSQFIIPLLQRLGLISSDWTQLNKLTVTEVLAIYNQLCQDIRQFYDTCVAKKPVSKDEIEMKIKECLEISKQASLYEDYNRRGSGPCLVANHTVQDFCFSLAR